MEAEKQLLAYINRELSLALGPAYSPSALRAALKRIASEVGRLQVVYAGKAHPNDQEGKKLIQRIFHLGRALKDSIPIAFLANYDVGLAKMITSGVDLWLNTPQALLWRHLARAG